MEIEIASGSEIVIESIEVQLLLSVTVTVKVPALKPVAVVVVYFLPHDTSNATYAALPDGTTATHEKQAIPQLGFV